MHARWHLACTGSRKDPWPWNSFLSTDLVFFMPGQTWKLISRIFSRGAHPLIWFMKYGHDQTWHCTFCLCFIAKFRTKSIQGLNSSAQGSGRASWRQYYFGKFVCLRLPTSAKHPWCSNYRILSWYISLMSTVMKVCTLAECFQYLWGLLDWNLRAGLISSWPALSCSRIPHLANAHFSKWT